MTECTQERFGFADHFSRSVVAGFEGERTSSDGGGLLLREVERRLNIVSRLAGCFGDLRDASRVEHSAEEMLRQRLFSLASGYEDLNEAVAGRSHYPRKPGRGTCSLQTLFIAGYKGGYLRRGRVEAGREH